jgi:hypothetical protein
MSAIEISEATSKETAQRIKLMLPDYAWQMLRARAKTYYDGNINKCVEEMFKERLFPWILENMISSTTMS